MRRAAALVTGNMRWLVLLASMGYVDVLHATGNGGFGVA